MTTFSPQSWRAAKNSRLTQAEADAVAGLEDNYLSKSRRESNAWPLVAHHQYGSDRGAKEQ